MSVLRWAALGALLAAACSPVPPFGIDGGESPDSGAGGSGGGSTDAGSTDAGSTDAGSTDAGSPDAGGPDAGSIDAGSPDAGSPDAGSTDAGSTDAGSPDAGSPDAGSCSACPAYLSAPANVGVIAVGALNEISGLAASRVHLGVLYAHNDSGGQPVVYAFSRTGTSLGAFTLVGAVNNDWEDMAIGPCPAGSCLYVGEIGDNGSNAPYPYAVYRFAEPSVEVTAPAGALSVAAEKFELRYPNGDKHDAETLMVHPTTGDVYVVTKHAFGTKSAVYKATAPLSSTAVNPLVKVADLAVPAGTDLPLTGGDIHPCASAVLLRSYSAIYQFALTADAGFDGVFTAPFTRVPAPPLGLNASSEAQGEAIAWADDGRGYFTASEGASPQLHFVGCP